MKTRTLAVVSAGLSEPSSTRLLADRLAAAARSSLQEQGFGLDVRLIELREHAHAVTDALLTGFTTPALQEALDSVVRADGVIAVTPIFSASYSGLFKTFFDVLEKNALDGKPVLIGATAGTARHSLALEHAIRPLFSYLHAVVTPTAVFAATEDWGAESGLPGRIARASGELADLVAARRQEAPADPYADAVPFEQLLAGLGGR